MAHRINIMLDEDNWAKLQAIPAGERSRLINESLSVELLRRQRLAAVERLDALRKTMTPAPGCSEDWIRADRESH
jgi:hypothetical protein